MTTKIMLFIALFVLSYLMTMQIILGIKTRKNICHLKDGVQPFTKHKKYGRIIFFFMLALVISIELMVRIKGSVVKTDDLFYFHIAFSSAFFVTTFFLNWPFNGQRSKHHKEMAYWGLTFFLVMIGTAVPIILRLE